MDDISSYSKFNSFFARAFSTVSIRHSYRPSSANIKMKSEMIPYDFWLLISFTSNVLAEANLFRVATARQYVKAFLSADLVKSHVNLW